MVKTIKTISIDFEVDCKLKEQGITNVSGLINSFLRDYLKIEQTKQKKLTNEEIEKEIIKAQGHLQILKKQQAEQQKEKEEYWKHKKWVE